MAEPRRMVPDTASKSRTVPAPAGPEPRPAAAPEDDALGDKLAQDGSHLGDDGGQLGQTQFTIHALGGDLTFHVSAEFHRTNVGSMVTRAVTWALAHWLGKR